MAKLEINSLRKEYDDVIAVDDLDISAEDGEFIVVVGPSGCGKSTSLNCVAGLITPTSGSIVLGEEEITNLRPQDRDIAMVFQNYALYPHMTVGENLRFALKMSTDMSSKERNERVDEIANLLHIDDLISQKPKELSGGQQQRVALGRAIVRKPGLFLMDEPLSNLDAKLRSEMRIEIQQLQKQIGTTTLYVTHDQTEAMTMGDRIAVMNEGVLQQIGTPLEIYNRPANRFVAGFIGEPSMNFFDVTKREKANGAIELQHDLFTHTIQTHKSELAETRDELTLGIRPNDIEVASADASNTVETEADVVEPMGDVDHVYFSHEDETYTASLAVEEHIRRSDSVVLSFPESRIYLFDRASGEAVAHPPERTSEAQIEQSR
ncbi:ABC transporter ATP-binding protein [Haloferax sp. YSSS75]|uniref:ABC transporter ATP-binding protein n=1 Tax=Haloferax sp. YSSS75 TaxID=3388564 RepID=UPI00398C8A08